MGLLLGAWEYKENDDISEVQRVDWTANSPDLNMTEQAWYHLKIKVTEFLYVVFDYLSLRCFYNLISDHDHHHLDRQTV